MAYCRGIVKFISIFSAIISQTVSAETYEWEQTVTFAGKVTLEKFYGPPNYGETPEIDQKEEIPLLDIGRSIRMTGISYGVVSKATDQNKIQLITEDGGQIKAAPCVNVTGTLFEAISGHHHTPVLLKVSHISLCAQK